MLKKIIAVQLMFIFIIIALSPEEKINDELDAFRKSLSIPKKVTLPDSLNKKEFTGNCDMMILIDSNNNFTLESLLEIKLRANVEKEYGDVFDIHYERPSISDTTKPPRHWNRTFIKNSDMIKGHKKIVLYIFDYIRENTKIDANEVPDNHNGFRTVYTIKVE